MSEDLNDIIFKTSFKAKYSGLDNHQVKASTPIEMTAKRVFTQAIETENSVNVDKFNFFAQIMNIAGMKSFNRLDD